MRKSNDLGIQLLMLVLGLLVVVLLGGTNTAAAESGGHEMHMTAGRQMHMATAARTVDIVRDPADVPSPAGKRPPAIVQVSLTAEEVVGRLDPASGATYRYWTFNGKVPGPMIRVREGDTVEVTLHNDAHSHMVHSVDFHAVLGPGGGAAFTQVVPGQSKTFTFQATSPGLFVYHCGTPMIAEHIANGMYGLILVEPAGGLPPVDHEYYVMRGEIYTAAPKGTAGLQQFSDAKLMQEDPEYFVFNGAVDALTKEHPLQAKVGETVRIFFGDAGPNKPSSLHVAGEMFTQDYRAGSLTSPALTNVQTALVAPGSAAILQLKAVEPGQFNLMDHAMARMAKGLVATLDVTGAQNAALIHPGPASPDSHAVVSGMTPADMAYASTSPAVTAGTTASGDTANLDAMSSMAMPHTSASASTASKHAQVLPAKSSLSMPASSPAELNGCLIMRSNGEVTLKDLGSQKTYRLEARPLLFIENNNHLVHVGGHPGSVVTDEDPHASSFVVDTVDELAPTCSAKITPSVLREAAAKSAGAGTGPAVTVGMTDMAFLPTKIVVNAGQKVVWKNTSRTVHNVVDDASKAMNKADVQLPAGVSPFGSDFLQPGQTFSRVFTTPGAYHYVCTLHEGNGMKGVIIVK